MLLFNLEKEDGNAGAVIQSSSTDIPTSEKSPLERTTCTTFFNFRI